VAIARFQRIAAVEGRAIHKGDVPRRIGRTKGGLNSKLHAVCDGQGRPLVMLLSEGQMSDYKGAALMMEAIPPAKAMLADRGYDADWFRDALTARGITPHASRRKPTGKFRSRRTRTSTASATRSRTCLAASKTGGASQPATTAVLTPSSRPSPSQQLSSSGYDQ
jgi:transposase